MHAHLHAVAAGLDDAEQFHAVAEQLRKADVARGERLDAFHEDLLRRHPEAIRQRSEDDRLVRGIAAIHIERGIGLGIARRLRLGERSGEAHLILRHPREDVVARAVDDAVDRLDVVADEGLANRFDDRNPTTDRRLEEHRHAMRRRRREDLFAVLGEQRLVAGDHDFLPLDRAENEPQTFLFPAHQLHHDLDLRVIEQLFRARGEKCGGHFDPARFRDIANGNFFHRELKAEPLPEQGAIERQVLEDTCADISQSCEADAELLHVDVC